VYVYDALSRLISVTTPDPDDTGPLAAAGERRNGDRYWDRYSYPRERYAETAFLGRPGERSVNSSPNWLAVERTQASLPYGRPRATLRRIADSSGGRKRCQEPESRSVFFGSSPPLPLHRPFGSGNPVRL